MAIDWGLVIGASISPAGYRAGLIEVAVSPTSADALQPKFETAMTPRTRASMQIVFIVLLLVWEGLEDSVCCPRAARAC